MPGSAPAVLNRRVELLEEENARLRQMVRDAYTEGWNDRQLNENDPSISNSTQIRMAWRSSWAKQRLEKV